MKRPLLVALVIPLALALAIFAKVGASAADSGTSGSGSGSGGPPVPCSYSPSYLCVPDRLYGVAGTSAGDVWAVGLMPTSSLIMHWNGSSWAVSYDQPVGYFLGVSAVSATDAWAVGGTSWWNPSQTLAEHWDGTSWTQVATPVQGGSAIFGGVAATSATNAWAVGDIGPGPGVPASASPLIEHWDGTAWSAQSFAVPPDGGQFTAVAAISADDAWAVGSTGAVSEGTGQTTMIEHWDGTSWTRVASPNATGSANILSAVTIVSHDDAWAVGLTTAYDGTWQALIEHWNGSTWSVVPNPDPTGDTNLRGVAAASADDVWAVGYSNATRCGGGPQCQTVAMHWDGSTWTVVSTPDPPSTYLNAFLGVAAISGGDVWAVGTTDYAGTLIANWNGSDWRD
jgi:hypothetical protein